ncbi:hypothetical protein JCM33374_g2249 [Metschnikowia sp. JCM 33374]|nr:hypothetical protein JCM33374_g2249 [Metschnikowia sp. JCM 33374]
MSALRSTSPETWWQQGVVFERGLPLKYGWKIQAKPRRVLFEPKPICGEKIMDETLFNYSLIGYQATQGLEDNRIEYQQSSPMVYGGT